MYFFINFTEESVTPQMVKVAAHHLRLKAKSITLPIFRILIPHLEFLILLLRCYMEASPVCSLDSPTLVQHSRSTSLRRGTLISEGS